MYSAFVRQFGVNCARPVSEPPPETVEKLDAENYTVIPPSGTFRQLAAKLDHIFDRLGCRILQLLPIHPMPTQYGRMGRYGSPFAALDYFSIDRRWPISTRKRRRWSSSANSSIRCMPAADASSWISRSITPAGRRSCRWSIRITLCASRTEPS